MTTTTETPITMNHDDEAEHTLHITNATGDTRYMWDPNNRAEVATAKAAFEKGKSEGMLAYRVNKKGEPKTDEVIRNFDPEAGKIVMVRPLAGG